MYHFSPDDRVPIWAFVRCSLAATRFSLPLLRPSSLCLRMLQEWEWDQPCAPLSFFRHAFSLSQAHLRILVLPQCGFWSSPQRPRATSKPSLKWWHLGLFPYLFLNIVKLYRTDFPFPSLLSTQSNPMRIYSSRGTASGGNLLEHCRCPLVRTVSKSYRASGQNIHDNRCDHNPRHDLRKFWRFTFAKTGGCGTHQEHFWKRFVAFQLSLFVPLPKSCPSPRFCVEEAYPYVRSRFPYIYIVRTVTLWITPNANGRHATNKNYR